jgi:TIR domain-containing protein
VKIFISWSGAKAKAAAYALRDWLPSVIQSLDTPWVSDVDIESGANWSASIGSELAGAKLGIICVTHENQDRPWLNFEAGAISKLVGGAVPLLIDFDSPGDLSSGPMSQLQVRMPDIDGITKLMHDINRRLEKPLDTKVLDLSLQRSFVELEEKLMNIRNDPTYAAQSAGKRSLDEKVDELLSLARSEARDRVTNVVNWYDDLHLPSNTHAPLNRRWTTRVSSPKYVDVLEELSERSDPSATMLRLELLRRILGEGAKSSPDSPGGKNRDESSDAQPPPG